MKKKNFIKGLSVLTTLGILLIWNIPANARYQWIDMYMYPNSAGVSRASNSVYSIGGTLEEYQDPILIQVILLLHYMRLDHIDRMERWIHHIHLVVGGIDVLLKKNYNYYTIYNARSKDTLHFTYRYQD